MRAYLFDRLGTFKVVVPDRPPRDAVVEAKVPQLDGADSPQMIFLGPIGRRSLGRA